MDNLNIQLDASELIKASNEAAIALTSLKAKFMELSNATPAGQLKAQIQGVLTEMTSASDAIGKVFGQIGTAAAKAQVDAKVTGKKVGKAVVDGMAEGIELDAAVIAKSVASAINQATSPFQRYSPTSGLKGRVVVPDNADNARFESEAARIRNSLNKLFDEQDVSDTFRSLQGAVRTDSAVVLRLLGDYYRQLEANGARSDAAWKRVNSTEPVNASFRSLQSELHQDKELVQAELSSYYQRLQADGERLAAAWKRIGNPEQVSASFRSLTADLRSNTAVIQAELVKFYGELQRVSDVKDAIRKRLAGGTSDQDLARKSLGNTGPVSVDGVRALSLDNQDLKYAQDMGAMRAYYQTLQGGAPVLDDTKKKMDGLRESKRLVGEESKLLAESQRNLHSAFRGVAAAGSQLFLTYGQLLPLVGAFAAASAIRQSITDFKDLEYQLKFVQAVADDTSVSMREMMASVTSSAKQVGADPVEAAKGMRILAQAGLNTQEALNALPDVLRLATVGELDMAQAAETVTGAVNAFGLGVGNIGRVSDVFFKAAAMSNTSVRSISESMKQASTIAERYKISVEEVGVSLVALAKRNITGSSAGTALTQMFEELATPRGEAKKVASQLGITLFDPLKHDFKDFFGKFVPELREKLKVFDPESQTFIMNRLTNNRGAKALSALMGLSDADLQDLKTKLDDATGATQKAVIELNDSVEGDLKKLKSAFKETLADAGAQGADSLRASLQNLRDVISSPELKEGLGALVSGFTSLLQLVTWLGKKSTELSALHPLLGALLNPLGAVSDLLRKIDELTTSKDAVSAAAANIDSKIKKEREYQGTLDDSISKLRVKLGLEGANKPTAESLQGQIEAQQAKLREAQLAYDAAMAKPRTSSLFDFGTQVEERKAAKQALDAANYTYSQLLAIESRQANSKALTQGKEEELKRLQGMAAAAAQATKPGATGTQRFVMPDTTAANSAAAELRRQLELAANARKQDFSMAEEDERHREAMLKDSYERGTIKFGEYQSELEAMQRAASARRLAVMLKEKAQLEDQAPQLQEAFDKARAAGSKTDVQRTANDLEAFRQKVQDLQLQIEKLNNKDSERLSDSLTRALKPANDLATAAQKDLVTQEESVRQEIEKLRVKSNGARLTEREEFVQSEILRITNAQVEALKKYQAELSRMMAEGGFSVLGDDGLGNPEALAAWQRAQTNLANMRMQLDDSQRGVAAAAAQAFDANKVDEYARSLNSSLADGIISAGEDGGEGLRRALEDALIRKPLKIILEAVMKPATDAMSKTILDMVNGAIKGFSGSVSGFSAGSGYGSGINANSGEYMGSLEFDGGGYTGGGSRSGGLDGRGGFMAMLHPQESVVDHYRGQRGPGPSGGSTKVDVVVNNYSGAQATTQEVVDSRGNRRIEVTLGDMQAGEILRPGSATHQANRQAFGSRPVLVRR